MNVPHWDERFDSLIHVTELDELQDLADRVFLSKPEDIAAVVRDAELAADFCWRVMQS